MNRLVPVNLKFLRDRIREMTSSSGHSAGEAHRFMDTVRRAMEFGPLIEAIQELQEDEKIDP